MALPTTYSWTLSIGPSPTPSVTSGVSGSRGISGEGKTGLAIPFGTDGRGRLALVSGEAQLQKIIILNLSDLDSANPFQGDIGLGADMIFALADERLRTELRRRINSLFRRLQLQDRARLAEMPKFTTNSELQELNVDINYINLEEDKPGTLSVKFSMIPQQADVAASLVSALSGA